MNLRKIGAAAALCMGLCLGMGALSSEAAAATGLAAYRSEAEFDEAIARWRAEAARRRGEALRLSGSTVAPTAPASIGDAAPLPAPAPMAAAPAPAAAGAAKVAEASRDDSITNVQTAGVDEGGIVKRAGDHLVILRRGRLFTVRVGGDALAPVAVLDAYAPGASPQGAWYDELLVSGSTVVVVGYSYARGGTEIGLFEIGADGSLRYRATHHLRSFDYYSSRNYASRLVGRTLVFYSPLLFNPWDARPLAQSLPAWRRWQGTSTPADFQRILPATRIHRTDDEFDPMQALALHTVTRCTLDDADLRCESSAVLGPAGRVFYVSQGSVYIWTAGANRYAPQGAAQSAVFRLPLDGSTPTGLKTSGVPIDQMSFLEDAGGHLNVLLRAQGSGEGMWGADSASGASGMLALLRLPLAALGDGRTAAQREHYRVLPADSAVDLQNRFIGDWLVWGGRARPLQADLPRRPATGWALRYAAPGAPTPLRPGHAIERIEAMGAHAVLVGNAGADLVFSSLRLGRQEATPAGRHVQPGARQGERRTHGFFHRVTGTDEGLLGLPVIGGSAAPATGVASGGQGSAAVLFLRERALAFAALGELRARGDRPADDGCKASCVDWYGNARPIFLGERIFALLGYELVEGRLDGQGAWERIDERRRIGFAPSREAAAGRTSPFN